MLSRVLDRQGYGMMDARAGLVVGLTDHQVVAYRVPVEWGSLSLDLRGAPSLGLFQDGSKRGFLASYAAFRCVGCWVCGGRVG